MELMVAYFISMLVSFLLAAICYYSARGIFWISVAYCGCGTSCQRDRELLARQQQRQRNRNEITINRDYQNFAYCHDRQGNIYTISDETLNANNNRYADFFYLEPNSEEAARIRAQLEKDEKDLPSYDEVMMGMNNLNAPTAGVAASSSMSNLPTSTATVSTNITPSTPPLAVAALGGVLTPPPPPTHTASIDDQVPPYSEVDPITVIVMPSEATITTTRSVSTATIPPSNASTNTPISSIVPVINAPPDIEIDLEANATALAAAPSTSRAAAAAALVTTVPIMSTSTV